MLHAACRPVAHRVDHRMCWNSMPCAPMQRKSLQGARGVAAATEPCRSATVSQPRIIEDHKSEQLQWPGPCRHRQCITADASCPCTTTGSPLAAGGASCGTAGSRAAECPPLAASGGCRAGPCCRGEKRDSCSDMGRESPAACAAARAAEAGTGGGAPADLNGGGAADPAKVPTGPPAASGRALRPGPPAVPARGKPAPVAPSGPTLRVAHAGGGADMLAIDRRAPDVLWSSACGGATGPPSQPAAVEAEAMEEAEAVRHSPRPLRLNRLAVLSASPMLLPASSSMSAVAASASSTQLREQLARPSPPVL